MVTITGYHGTSKESANNILKYKIYIDSNSDSEWLGTGVYFFIDDDKDKAINNAKKWAINYKKFSFYSVIETTMLTEEEKIIDLNDPEWQDLYHQYRNARIKEIINRGIRFEVDINKFECSIINPFAEKIKATIIIQDRFIKLEEFYYKNKEIRIPKSNVANCRIACVRDRTIIDNNSIKCVKEGSKYG